MKKLLNSYLIKEIGAGIIGLMITLMYGKIQNSPIFMTSLDSLFYVIIPVFLLVTVAYYHHRNEAKKEARRINLILTSWDYLQEMRFNEAHSKGHQYFGAGTKDSEERKAYTESMLRFIDQIEDYLHTTQPEVTRKEINDCLRDAFPYTFYMKDPLPILKSNDQK